MAAHSTSWEHCKHAGGLRATSADVFVAIYHCLLWFYLYIYILLPSGITSINTLCLKNMCWFFYQLQRGRTMLVLSFEGFLKFIFLPLSSDCFEVGGAIGTMISLHLQISISNITWWLRSLSLSCRLKEVFLAPAVSGLIIMDLHLHLDFCKAASLLCLQTKRSGVLIAKWNVQL